MSRRRWIAAVVAALVSGAASAQSWPTRPLRVVVPFTPGSATDIIARAVTERLALGLGQSIVVENRAGAGGTIGAAIVAKSDPDGYTILVQSSSHTVTPTTYPNLPYDTMRDLAGITPLAVQPNALVVSPAKGYKSVADLVAAAKAKPGSLNYASAGAGSATHLNAERFRIGAGLEGVHIPFKGTPEAMTEIIAGRVDIFFAPVVSAFTQIKEGKVQALAVGSPKRSSVLPQVPTTVEAGVPNSDYTFWIGMIVPAKTPRDIVQKLHQETIRAIESAEVRDRYAKLGAEPFPLTPEAFDRYIREEIATNAALVKAAKISLN